ncbi:hypothetical protein CAL7716_057520 [Calothrix sp. PCC 7716]|nr:hypothetical protein CAL7716_057520 [Calothrix sp. PCC 7716]
MVYKKNITKILDDFAEKLGKKKARGLLEIEKIEKQFLFDSIRGNALRLKELIEQQIEVEKLEQKLYDIKQKIFKNRTCREINGYHNWDEVLGYCVRVLYCCEVVDKNIEQEVILLKTLQLVNHFVEHQGNTYWVDKDFLQQVSNNALKPEKLPTNIPCGLLLFPSLISPQSPNSKKPIDWVMFAHIKSGVKLPPTKTENKLVELPPIASESIIWMTYDVSEDGYYYIYTGAILADTLEIVIDTDNQKLTREEKAIVKDISNLLVQSLAYAENPETEYVDSVIGFGKHTKHKARLKQPKFINPKWIGRGVKVYSPRAATVSLGGTHNSPIPHQRRGYTRHQPCGPGRKEIRLVEIPATIVNKDKSPISS